MALTPEQIKEAFNLFDADGSGSIDASEMKLVLKGLGFTDITEGEIKAMIQTIDTDRSGSVEYKEFEEMVLRRMKEAGSPEEINKAYNLFDTESRGRITFEDLKRVALLEDPTIGDDEVQRVLECVAQNPDRGITYQEWKDVMLSLKDTSRRATKA
eukprot:Sspe_Gene.2512::Locus_835_Transcript_1_1_Confidence_1.000_Length_693::g.2512::m.2512/K16465/CETN1; centrin-1